MAADVVILMLLLTVMAWSSVERVIRRRDAELTEAAASRLSFLDQLPLIPAMFVAGDLGASGWLRMLAPGLAIVGWMIALIGLTPLAERFVDHRRRRTARVHIAGKSRSVR